MKRVEGLAALGASSALVTAGALDQYDDAARSIAAQVVDPAHRAYLVPCRPKDESRADDACAAQFITEVGRLLFRRPLTAGERELNTAVAREAATRLNGFYPGLSAALAGMLVAPEFLLITQIAEQDPRQKGAWRLTAHSKAARLSLLFWNAYPDDELLKAAENGSIHSERGLTAQVDRMLASPSAAAAVRSFFDDMLILDAFETLTKYIRPLDQKSAIRGT